MAGLKFKFFLFFVFAMIFAIYAQTSGDLNAKSVQLTAKNVDYATDGFEAYRNGDWNTAVFLLKKSVSLYGNNSPDTLYMLIMAQINGEDYKGALSDIEDFLEKFPSSPYFQYVKYQKGRVSYYLGDYDTAVMFLSDFCHENPESEMYASAIFWIAESFYVACRYSTARALYERIVNDFSADSKAVEAKFRIETIDQRSREEKLLYLLRMTGEEYLAAKENYERQLRESRTEGLVGVQRQLKVEKDKNVALTAALEEQKAKNAELSETIENLNQALESAASAPHANPEILFLKRKASEIESLLNSKTGE